MLYRMDTAAVGYLAAIGWILYIFVFGGLAILAALAEIS